MNNKFKSIAISTIIASIMMSGCGSNSSDDNSHELTKEVRVVMHGQNSDDFQGTLTVNDNADTINLSVLHSSLNNAQDMVHNQFYLDTDDNINTGYAGMDGADFLISDGNLYRSNGRNWNWQYVRPVSSNISNNTISAAVNKSLLGDISNSIGIVACSMNNRWRITDIAQQRVTLNADGGGNNGIVNPDLIAELIAEQSGLDVYDIIVTPNDRFAIVTMRSTTMRDDLNLYNLENPNHPVLVDNLASVLQDVFRNVTLVGNRLRYEIWSSPDDDVGLAFPRLSKRIITYDYENHREVNVINYDFNAKIFRSTNNNNTVFNVSFSEDTAETANTVIIYINSDGNTETGFNGRYGSGLEGADFMIANGFLYRSTGRGWSWQDVGNIDYVRETAQSYTATVPNNIFNMSENATASVIVKDRNWNTIDRGLMR